jgi:hypothetical protein
VKKQAKYRKGFASQLRTDRSKTFFACLPLLANAKQARQNWLLSVRSCEAKPFLSLACFFTFYLTFYLTFGEIARLGEIERVTISNEGEIEGRKQEIERVALCLLIKHQRCLLRCKEASIYLCAVRSCLLALLPLFAMQGKQASARDRRQDRKGFASIYTCLYP